MSFVVADQKQSTSTETSVSTPSISASAFIWGVGVECSFIPHIDVDQFEWTQHDRFWREDLQAIRKTLGVTHMRYALPWHKIEVTPGVFDWTMADERMAYCQELGIEVMLDVMHFGTPTWLPQAVGDPRFPEALESFTTALVERYRHQVKIWCPFNEPLVSALFSGDFGFWPPFARKWRGYMPVLSRIVQAVSRSIAAIRRAQPEATVMLCDALENYQTRSPELQTEVDMRNQRRFLVLDLLSGRVDQTHPLYSWITSFGFSELDLKFLAKNPQMPDWIGLDYYPHSDWQIELQNGRIRQRRADAPLGLGVLARATYDRYGLPLIVTETSVDGPPIAREIWLHSMVQEIRELREDGIPMAGLIWWPAFDQIDWDGALTHRVGKIHRVGLFTLNRQPNGTLERKATPLAAHMREMVEAGDEMVGELAEITPPSTDEDQHPALFDEATDWIDFQKRKSHTALAAGSLSIDSANGGATSSQGKVRTNSPDVNGHTTSGSSTRSTDSTESIGRTGLKNDFPSSPSNLRSAPSTAVDGNESSITANLIFESSLGSRSRQQTLPAKGVRGSTPDSASVARKATDRYGILVFSHLRWGFVWQRPQQFLSRFARFHPVLFVEEPWFDLPAGAEPRLELHSVLPNVTVFCPHCPPEMASDKSLPEKLRQWVKDSMSKVSNRGEFDRPLLWYYSPMDASWSLGHFENRGIVYDCMDELAAFTGAPPALLENESRLIDAADIVFTGGYELWSKKKQLHPNAHFYGCGVEFDHFGRAADPSTSIPPDIDFLPRPLIGWFGVVDERVDYHLLAEVARMRKDWTFALVGPVVKVDPNLLPHAPNLHWLGQRDYQQLPNYCAAFDVCMMCFAINSATEYINPTKALEYLATGRPVISTRVKDVVRQYTDYVELAATAQEFVEKVDRMLADPDRSKIAAGLELAKQKSWESTVTAMRKNITEAISQSARRSDKVMAIADPDPAQLYRSTQGS